MTGDRSANRALSALIRATFNTGAAGLARYKRTEDAMPVVGALFPKIKNLYDAFDFIQLPYAEDVRDWPFPVLPIADIGKTGNNTSRHTPNERQLELVDSLMDIMDLTRHEELSRM